MNTVQNEKADLVYQSTGIPSFDELLGKNHGICYLKSQGLFGVIFGAAGSGKSILAMQLCCGFIQKQPASSFSEDGKVLGKAQNNARLLRKRATLPRCAIYISQEPTELVQKQIERFNGFRVPGKTTPGFNPERDVSDTIGPLFKLDRPQLFVWNLPLEAKLQKEKLINIFDIIAGQTRQLNEILSSRGSHLGDYLLVCVDNMETITDDAFRSVLETAPNDPNFYRQLRSHCAGNRINTFFVFEEQYVDGRSPEQSDISTTAQAYAADIVLRLGVHTFANGYRERYLEIVKAKNQFHRRGRHHFTLRDKPEAQHPPGVIIFPSLAAQLYQMRMEEGPENPKFKGRINLGIPKLDEKIKNAIGSRSSGYIERGTASVLVADLDVKPTEIALHFALNARSAAKPDRRLQCLYISFLHQAEALRTEGVRFSDLSEALNDKNGFGTEQESFCRVAHFAPEHISEGKLLCDIDLLLQGKDELKKSQPRETVVVDNIFALSDKFPLLTNPDHFLAALIALFRARGVTALLIDMVEVGEGRNPIEKSKVAGWVENVFLLRHVEFQSRQRNVFSVQKLMGNRPPETLWELDEQLDPKAQNQKTGSNWCLAALETFELYKNVLVGEPKPMRITMSLYNDKVGSPLDRYLNGQKRALEQTFGEMVTVNLYGADEYSRAQNILTFAKARPLADCHIVSIDEFWMEQLIEKKLLQEIGGILSEDPDRRAQFVKKGQYVTAAHDIALTLQYHRKGEWLTTQTFKVLKEALKKLYAIPDRNNCGIFCCHLDAIEGLLAEVPAGPLKQRVDLWHADREQQRSRVQFTWDDILQLKDVWASKQRPGEPANTQLFTFCMDQMESCVSFLLELTLSMMGEKERLCDKDGNLRWKHFEKSLPLLIGLLAEQDIQVLREARFRPSDEEPPALFSRQWMSALGSLRSRQPRRGKTPERQMWHRALLPLELPLAKHKGHPTPVSGAWYLGILHGSQAVHAGVRVIKHFTAIQDDLYKLNHYIGLPVRRSFYESTPHNSPSFSVPYGRRFVQIAGIQKSRNDSKRAWKAYEQEVLHGEYPFYRMLIKDYHYVAPILWRMMVDAARKCVLAGGTARLDKKSVKQIIELARARFVQIPKKV